MGAPGEDKITPTVAVLAPKQDVRNGIRVPLEKEGLRVRTYPEEGPLYDHLAVRGYPDLVVLSSDVEEGGDRAALLVGLRVNEKRTPVIVVAGLKDRENAARLVRMGAAATLVFPLEEDELVAVCRRALREAGWEAELRRVRADMEDFRAFLLPTLGFVHDAVVVFDENSGTVVYANQQAASDLGVEFGSLDGRPPDRALLGPALDAVEEARGLKEGWFETDATLGGEKRELRAVVLRTLANLPLGSLVAFRSAGRQA